ncbi:gypsy type transposase [Tanacetum coccineum]
MMAVWDNVYMILQPDDNTAILVFGEWGDSNLSSAEGYSYIFNKVQEEKHDDGGKSPRITSNNSAFYGERVDAKNIVMECMSIQLLFVRQVMLRDRGSTSCFAQSDTMHVRLARKIRHFRINISQLSVIGAAKVSHFEILCRVYGIIPTVGLFWCFYVNSKKNGWMSFSKRSDNAPVSSDFNAQDYATLVAYPSPFQKFPEEFLCLFGLSCHYTLDEETYPWFLNKNGEEMDIFAFIHTLDPTKVKVVERERIEDEPLLLETTVGRTVPLLPVVPDRAKSELEASVDRLFNEGGSGNQMEQGDSVGGRQGADIQPSSHPPKRLREDHETSSGASVGVKFMYAVQRLLAGAMLNADVRGGAIPTLPFVTSSVSTTLKRKDGDYTDSVAEPNLQTVSFPQRFVICLDSSHHSVANVAEAEVDSLVRSSVPVMTTVTTVTSMVDHASIAKEKPVEPSLLFAGSSSAGGTDLATRWLCRSYWQ